MERSVSLSTVDSNSPRESDFERRARAYSQEKANEKVQEKSYDDLKDFLYIPTNHQEQNSTKKYTQVSEEYYQALLIQHTRKASREAQKEAQKNHNKIQEKYVLALKEHGFSQFTFKEQLKQSA